MDPVEPAARPWAQGVGLFLLGLFAAAVASSATWAPDPGRGTQVLGTIGYAAGVVVAGIGIHRLLWFRPTSRSRATRVLLTAAVTPLAFVAGALFFSVLFTLVQLRLRF